MTLDEYEVLTLRWSHDRGITINGKAETQTLKLVSEVGELCDNMAKGKDVKDDIGDCLVVLTNIAKLRGTNLTECWKVAYDDIKDRKGFLNEQGTFIKSTDAGYDKMHGEFKLRQLPEPTVKSCTRLMMLDPMDQDKFDLSMSDGTTITISLDRDFQQRHPMGVMGMTISQIEKG